jgi:tryptophan synthase alpha chain
VSATRTVPAGRLETALRGARERGRKVLVPYVTGGVSAQWPDFVAAALDAGADAVEVGIPFSDPAIDGPTIQQASVRALRRGTTLDTIIDDLGRLDRSAPLIAMTYYNLVLQRGHRQFAARLRAGGVCAVILPDLPVDESAQWEADAISAGIEVVQLASPVTPDDRLVVICQRSRGFVYGMGLMGVTGEREQLSASATAMARRLKAVTDKPVLIGVGVSTPDNAARVCTEADGVVIGAPLVRRILDGQSPAQTARFVASFRAAIDKV